MKKFFRGPVKKITVSNLELLENSCKCVRHIEIVKKNELFYVNFLGKIIRKRDRMPIILENEIEDIINFYAENGYKSFSTVYVDQKELRQVPVSKPKHLIRKNNPKK